MVDDERALVNARMGNQGMRGYLLEIASGSLEPVTEPETTAGFPSPDGRLFFQGNEMGTVLVAFDGSDTWEIQGFQPDDVPIGWAADGDSFYTSSSQNHSYPIPIFLINLKTGTREVFTTVEPPDRAGTGIPTSARINPDGSAWAISYPRIFSELHLVEGLE